MHSLAVEQSLGDLVLQWEERVVTVTINRPERRNAIDPVTWTALGRALREVRDRPSIRVFVLTGAGTSFCAGADLSTTAVAAVKKQSHLVFMRNVGDVIRALHDLPIPTIARVNGPAFGAGCNLALACDFVIASDSARFCEVFSRRGLALDSGASWLLPRLVGLHRAKELALLAPELSAVDALALGLVTRTVPAEQLDSAVAEVARQLAEGPPIALSLTKSMLNESFGSSLEEALEKEARAQTIVATSDDGAEALRAFAEKRVPRFSGR